MRSARIIPNHSSDGAAVVRGRVGRKGKLMLFGPAAERIEHHAGLHTRQPSLRIDFENLVHVFREIEHYGDVARLAREAGTRAPRQQGRAKLLTHAHRRDYIVCVARHHKPDWYLAVI